MAELDAVEYTLGLPVRGVEKIAAACAFDDGLFQHAAKPVVCE
jgi:hypothetical protein